MPRTRYSISYLTKLQAKPFVGWDSSSCSYDAVFMSFWFIYRKVPRPDGATSGLSNRPQRGTASLKRRSTHYILAMAQSGNFSQEALFCKFTSVRETFRNDLSQIHPVYVQRHGPVLASVCHILGHTYTGSVSSACEPRLAIHVPFIRNAWFEPPT